MAGHVVVVPNGWQVPFNPNHRGEDEQPRRVVSVAAPAMAHVPVTCVRLDDSLVPRETFQAAALEIAEEGLVLTADRPLKIDEPLRVSLQLRPDTTVRCGALVRHVQNAVSPGTVEYRILAVFSEVPPLARAELREWLDAHVGAEPQSHH